MMVEYQIKEFLREGLSPFGRWFDDLDSIAASKVTAALYRLQYGNFSNVRSLGSGVSEYKIDFGPGYRVYFGKDGNYSGYTADWRNKEDAEQRYRKSKGILAGI